MHKIDKVQKGFVSGDLTVLSVKKLDKPCVMGTRVAKVRCICGYEYEIGAGNLVTSRPPKACKPCTRKKQATRNRWNNGFPAKKEETLA